MSTELEFFQDLAIVGSKAQLDAAKTDILASLGARWSAAPAERVRQVHGYEDVIALEREGDDVASASGLFMMRRNDRYEVTNIVPRETGKLSRAQYNAILQDFVATIAIPVSERTAVRLELSAPMHTIEASLGEEGAQALRRFSGAANMSTGSSHPLDRRRWYDFIILVRDQDVDGGTLARWLVQLGWPEESAHDLVSEFEFGHGLLEREREG
ncbi:MAG: hypothetical protein K9G59_04600 [Caulobacter sp.]|nr:hypothetical protein [Caulobacter sp.]